MKKSRILFPAWMLTVVLLLSLALTAGVVYAGEPPGDTGDLKVTGYKVVKGSPANPSAASTFTGKIRKGDEVTIIVSVLDERITSGSPAPRAVLNTASFTIPKQSNITYSTKTADANGYAYDIVFSKLNYRGKGNTLEFNLSYSSLSLTMQPVALTLNQCVEYVASETPSEPAPDVIVKGTGFILKDARYGEGAIYAGQPFTLSAVILATNGASAVENVSVAFSPPEELTLSEGSSVVYIGTMAPNASVPVSATMLPGANIQEGSYTVSISVSGVNQQTGESVAAQMTVSVPVLQPERFEIFDAMLPTDLMVGMDNGMGYGSVTLVNMGKGAVSNVTVEIFGDGLSTDEGRQYLGNVGGGEQKSADFYIHAEMAGQIEAVVVVSYENVRGEKKTLERAFSVSVMEMEKPDFDGPGFEFPGDPGDVGVRTGPPLWLWIVIAVCAAVAVTAVLVRRRKKRLAAKEAALDEADDDDD